MRDQRQLMRNGHRLGSAERFLRAETFCERGARGGAEILVKREQSPIGPALGISAIGKLLRTKT